MMRLPMLPVMVSWMSLLFTSALIGFAHAADSNLPLIPGLKFNADRSGAVFNRGYDPVLLQSREPIVAYNFNNNNTHDNSWVFPDLGVSPQSVFSVPDEVHVYYTPGASLDKDLYVFTNVSEVKQWKYHNHFTAIFALVFNSVREHFDMVLNATLEFQGRVAALNEGQFIAFQTALYSSDVLGALMQEGGSQYNSTFAQEVRNLPQSHETEEDQQAYQAFTRKFGTHYVSSSVYGASLTTVAAIEADLLVKLGDKFDFNVNVALEFLFIFAGLQFSLGIGNNFTFDVDFAENANIMIMAQGGNAAAFSSGRYNEWLDSIKFNPVPINTTYTAIADLVSAYDSVRGANLYSAAETYIKSMQQGDFPAYSCASPPGPNLTVHQLPTPPADYVRPPVVSSGPSYYGGVPAPLPELKLSSVGFSYDARAGQLVDNIASAPVFLDQDTWADPARNQSFLVPQGSLLTAFGSVCAGLEEFVVTDLETEVDLWGKFTFAWFSFTIFDIPIHMKFKKFAAGAAASLHDFLLASISIEISFDLFHLQRGPEASQSPTFLADVNALPATSSESQADEAYDNFLNKYGTHYVSDEAFGGYCNFTVTYEQEMFANFSKDWKKAQARLKILSHLDVLGAGTWMNRNISTTRNNVTKDFNFSKHTNFSFSCTGGDPNILGTADEPNQGSWGQWLETVRLMAYPIYRKFRLSPLSDLVVDPNKRTLLNLATMRFVNATRKNGTAVGAAKLSEASFHRPQERVERARKEIEKHMQLEIERRTSTAAAKIAETQETGRKVDAGAIALSWVPGVCNGNGNIGIGCGYDITQLDVYGLAISPKKPVIKMPSCPLRCYLTCGSAIPPGDVCEDCCYLSPFADNKSYKVPDNVAVTTSTDFSSCFSAFSDSDMDLYDQTITQHWEHSSGFIFRKHWSKTQVDFYHMYYKRDDSQVLQSASLEYFTVTAMDLIPEPTFEFSAAVALLPLKYDYNRYKRIIQDFGTHYMTQVSMGGTALSATYYHSCLLETYGGEYVKEQSTSSFIFIYHEATADGHGINTTDKIFEEWSTTEAKLIGGEAWKYLKLTPNNTMNETCVKEWEKTVAGPKMAPVQFSLQPITNLIKNAIKQSNMNQAFADYDAEIGAQQASLTNVLKPQDPYVTPSWCKFDPHPITQPPTQKPPTTKPPTRSSAAAKQHSNSTVRRSKHNLRGLPPCAPLTQINGDTLFKGKKLKDRSPVQSDAEY